MNPTPVEQRVHFASDVDEQTNRYLQQAAAEPWSEYAGKLLERAAAASPAQLAVDVARYKYHFYRGEQDRARVIVDAALVKAAGQGGFDADWRGLSGPLPGQEVPESPARYYLYSLKALAFIALRGGDAGTCLSILDKLETLDPDDMVGSGVIRDLSDATEDEP